MKTRIVLGICLIASLLAILPDTVTLAGVKPIMPAVPAAFLHRGFELNAPSRMSFPAPVAPQRSRYPLISAQQACLQGGGWNWRRGQVPICFKSGHDSCPAGYPWMRQRTQRYTICLSVGQSGQFPPAIGGR